MRIPEPCRFLLKQFHALPSSVSKQIRIMKIFEIFINEQRFTVYSDDWEGGIHQVKSAAGNSRLFRIKIDLRWEELHPGTLDPLEISDDEQVQFLGGQIEKKLQSNNPENTCERRINSREMAPAFNRRRMPLGY
jgi:hypothetical protein